MSIYSAIAEGVQREQQSEKISGVVIGVVSKNKDDEGLGRVKVIFPWLSETEESQWARVATLMAGYDQDTSKPRGTYFLPEVGDEVLVAFEQGDRDRPYVIGVLWGGAAPPPLTNSDGKNNVRLIQSRSGHQITLDDSDGAEKIAITDKTGKNSIVWDAAENTITISAEKDIVLKAPNGKISLDAQELELKSSANTTAEASGTMTVKGSTVNIN
jgi:uncharacterized protein involved in type VI secretion and phage assembly